MGVKMGELNSRMGNMESTMETIKEYLRDPRESMLSKEGGDKGGYVRLNV